MISLRRLDQLGDEAMIEVAKSKGATPILLRNVEIHLEKPWIRNYRSMILAPLRKELGKFFKTKVLQTGDISWYFPSTFFWKVHARAAHPPGGAGCNPIIHKEFLTPTGKNAEFLYATVLKAGNLRILTAQDFVDECRWWAKNF